MKTLESLVAEKLLKIKAVKLQPANPFTWAPGSKVVIIEDLVSTGGSSLKAVQAVRNFGCDVAGMVAIFTYGFPVAEAAFKDAKVTLTTLSNYDAVLEEAVRTHYIDESEIAVLQEWRKDPANWDPK